MAKATINLKSKFADNTERKTELGPLAISAISLETLRNKIKTINQKIADPENSEYEVFCQAWVSDEGAEFTNFSSVSVNVEDKRIINLND